MRKFKASRFVITTLILIFSLSISNCALHLGNDRGHHRRKRHAPGHAKKMHGDRNAKHFAPGRNHN